MAIKDCSESKRIPKMYRGGLFHIAYALCLPIKAAVLRQCLLKLQEKPGCGNSAILIMFQREKFFTAVSDLKYTCTIHLLIIIPKTNCSRLFFSDITFIFLFAVIQGLLKSKIIYLL